MSPLRQNGSSATFSTPRQRSFCRGSSPTDQPESNVLYFVTEDDDKVVIRPSGTEPKIKLYFLVHGESEQAAEEKIAALTEDTAAFSRV